MSFAVSPLETGRSDDKRSVKKKAPGVPPGGLAVPSTEPYSAVKFVCGEIEMSALAGSAGVCGYVDPTRPL